MRALMLDFQPRRRSGPLGWSLLAVGVVLSLICVLVQQHLSDQTAQQQGHLKPPSASSPATMAARSA